ncbi:MAG: 4Fe-4S binding protein [Anaerolineae bacterium]|nr:4Fe-4S binding protein [Anaerolineae bacterium]
MIYVDEERCTGCGLCVEACPTGAMRLADGVAQVEQSLCRECQVCLSACPNGAVLAMQEPIPVNAPASGPTRPVAPEVRPGGLRPLLDSTRAFIQREVAPRAAALWESRGQPGVSPYYPRGVSRRGNYGGRGRGRHRRGRW